MLWEHRAHVSVDCSNPAAHVEALSLARLRFEPNPTGPCTQIVYTLAPMYLYNGYFKDKVYYLGAWTLN